MFMLLPDVFIFIIPYYYLLKILSNLSNIYLPVDTAVIKMPLKHIRIQFYSNVIRKIAPNIQTNQKGHSPYIIQML